jgi:asparagine synthase (glutamine-hydrolysing)
MMVCDALNYLPNDVLYKVDRTAMYNSLETRAPFLDDRIIDFAWQLPLSYKISKGFNKYIVRKLLEQYIPKNLIQNQKKGFTAPIDIWLRGPLNNWAENLLSKINLHKYPFLDKALINKIWVEHNVNLLNNYSSNYNSSDTLSLLSFLDILQRQNR